MTSRRAFLCGTLALGACMSMKERRKREIVDAQIHLWKADAPDVPWVPGAKPQMPEPFTIEKAIALMDEGGIDRAVIVTPALLGANNNYSLEAVRRYPSRFAVMGRIAQNNPAAAKQLASWKEQPGMLGIRVSFLGPTAKWLEDGTADWIWAPAEKAGLPVMFLTVANSAYFGRVAERHPKLPLIVDHMGVAGEATASGRREAAFEQALALAKYPNVSVKLSAIGNFSAEPYPFRDSVPYIRRLVEAYGARRCYWGTDITNSFAKATWRQRAEQLERLEFLSEDDKDWIMGRAIRARLGWS